MVVGVTEAWKDWSDCTVMDRAECIVPAHAPASMCCGMEVRAQTSVCLSMGRFLCVEVNRASLSLSLPSVCVEEDDDELESNHFSVCSYVSKTAAPKAVCLTRSGDDWEKYRC